MNRLLPRRRLTPMRKNKPLAIRNAPEQSRRISPEFQHRHRFHEAKVEVETEE